MKNTNLSQIIKVSSEIGLPTKKLLDIFFYLTKKQDLSYTNLSQLTGISKNILTQIKNSFPKYFVLSENLKLTPFGRKFAQDLNFTDYQSEETIYQFLQTPIYSQALLAAKSILSRPEPDRSLDQFIATPETIAKRVALLDFFQDLNAKRVLLLGDDDLLSLVISSLFPDCQISVLDIDRRLLTTIQSSKLAHPNLSFEIYDARNPLPRSYQDSFDVVFTDPPYTNEGISLFLSRAIQALDKSNHSARIYLCFGNSDRAKNRFLPITNLITQSGLMIRYIFDKFNRYSEANSIGSSSALYICDVTSNLKPIIPTSFNKKIYTNE